MLALMESLDTLAEAVGDPESTLDALSVNGTVGDLYIWRCAVAADTTGEAIGSLRRIIRGSRVSSSPGRKAVCGSSRGGTIWNG